MTSRPYDNRGRAESAAAARRRILDVAREKFVEHGYAGTTIAEIARAAAVSVQTVYAGFGGKAGLLKGAYDITLAGDDQQIPMAARPEFRRLAEAPDIAELLTSYAAVARSIMSRLRPMLPLIYGTRAVEPDLDALAITTAQERRFGAQAFAEHAISRGFLRAGLERDVVADLVWVLNAPETYLLLTQSAGLDDDGYQRWLETSLRAVLT